MGSFLLVHGAWHGAWCWYKVAALLRARGHEVRAIDLPSHGIDARAPGSVTLEDYVDAAHTALDGMSRPVVVGHSMGGIVLSALAEKHPERIGSLVYVAAFLLGDGMKLLDV